MSELKQVRAVSKLNRLSPQKTRLVANQIRGKQINTAFAVLIGLNNKSKRFVETTLKSAVANFVNKYPGTSEESLYVSEILIDAGPKLKRFRPRSMGRAFKILKPTCHVTVKVASKE